MRLQIANGIGRVNLKKAFAVQYFGTAAQIRRRVSSRRPGWSVSVGRSSFTPGPKSLVPASLGNFNKTKSVPQSTAFGLTASNTIESQRPLGVCCERRLRKVSEVSERSLG